jgi:hypothetical protein
MLFLCTYSNVVLNMTEESNSKKYWHYPVGKFMSFNEFTADIFQKKRLFLNSPVNFNDPYEGQNTEMPFLEHDTLITCFTGFGDENGLRSNTLFNPLMWSHYSDFNKGFCLIFDPLIAGLHTVNYTDTRVQDYNYTKTLLHKGTQWSHENEQRFISDKAGNVLRRVEYDNGNYYLKFYPDDLKAIVFGTKTAPEVKSKIFDYLSYFVMINDEGERGLNHYALKVHRFFKNRHKNEILIQL